MKNEPVAWMSPDGRFSTTEGKLFYIPLYTHSAKTLESLGAKFEKVLNDNLWELMEESPAKTLTDEEIVAIFTYEYGKSDYYSDTHQWAIEFARAILRKAIEK